MELNIYTDGGSINNPGQAAIAFIIYLDKRVVCRFSKKIGVASNNQAEYLALIYALKKTSQLIKTNPQIKKVVFFSDSRLMVNQINGFFKVKDSLIRERVLEIRILEQSLSVPVIYKNIPRENNVFADNLVKSEFKKTY